MATRDLRLVQIDDYNLMLKQSFEEKERLAQEMEQVR